MARIKGWRISKAKDSWDNNNGASIRIVYDGYGRGYSLILDYKKGGWEEIGGGYNKSIVRKKAIAYMRRNP